MERTGPTRRTLLRAGLVLPLAACTRATAPGPPPPPDVALRTAAVSRERELLALYDRALAADATQPRADVLARLRAEHAEHLVALGEAAGPLPPAPDPPPAVPTPPSPAPGAAELRAAEAAAAAGHGDGVVPASRELAAVLASLSAAEASHAVALA